ncbi:hypothetical protein I3B18_03925 [Salmonella enterica]|uniref:hypothetical protein n=1 Tax=Salmonella enterica TaxID=28901 RepID=UPI000DA3767B|nr:hypothetical protein [Salmonella enterica]EBY8083609.1 hypothetical protein [Salmonella enterica subsp. enterica serovar Banana]SQJ25219.1 Uncharacterised protein [Salmonella enterica subsp. enterica] [Salmonella enterica subsp. enterica serovar Menston]EAO3019200.1 hypothetical protein [Salmonella enterica]EAT7574308.1 hypothetical protein [Salmonella enterica]MBH0545357.1 hypothetical protein [Salmonella enterica]
MSRYADYLRADSCLSFGEYLVGTLLPEFEHRETGFMTNKYEYRMFRRVTRWFGSERDIEGEWCQTMKAAKASYKEALRKSKESAQ